MEKSNGFEDNGKQSDYQVFEISSVPYNTFLK